ncbi:hypothetical protein IAR55_000678 [Kwoniella newhampshirensis]|uniref:Uncharacterized protein n=1 Tax=Kwoniella newhampshirensis TaxID=1651941 RepID=A0AAW0Z788_9TREE
MRKDRLSVDSTLTGEAYDPQHLDVWQQLQALVALGRIPLASEVPLWTLLGCLVSSQIFPLSSIMIPTTPSSPFQHLDWWATIQCVLITWGTNISINYANEYFDWDLDRPGQVTAIRKDIKKKKEIEDEQDGHGSEEKTAEVVQEINEKIMSSSCRIIHDGTFPPYAALVCAMFFQFALVILILVSRITTANQSYDPTSSGSLHSSPFRGLALQVGIFSTILSQSYIGPPLRLHYHGFGEVVSSLFIAPVSMLFGILGHYTASTGRSIPFSDLFASTSASSTSGFHLDSQMWFMLFGLYAYEQARIFIMHIPDIEADKRGNKNTLTVRIGQLATSKLYVCFNALSILCFSIVGRQLIIGGGMLSRLSGIAPDYGSLGSPVAKAISRAWLTGLITTALFALPIMVIVSVSLFHAITPLKTTGGVPTLPVTELAKIVSLQTLITPLFLSATVAAAARIGWGVAREEGMF